MVINNFLQEAIKYTSTGTIVREYDIVIIETVDNETNEKYKTYIISKLPKIM